MWLSDIAKFDQKNRVRIPTLYLRLLGIEDNDVVQVMVDTDARCIKIVKIDDEIKRILKDKGE